MTIERAALRRFFFVQSFQEPGKPVIRDTETAFFRLFGKVRITSSYSIYFLPFLCLGVEAN